MERLSDVRGRWKFLANQYAAKIGWHVFPPEYIVTHRYHEVEPFIARLEDFELGVCYPQVRYFDTITMQGYIFYGLGVMSVQDDLCTCSADNFRTISVIE